MNEYSRPLSPAGQSWEDREAERLYQDMARRAVRRTERTQQQQAVTRITDNPDQAGEARRIARQVGVPAPLVQERLPDYKADARRAEVAEAARDGRVGPWLAQNADVAGDDIATLVNLGRTGDRFRIAAEGSPTRYTFSRRQIVDENFRPQELTKAERDALRKQAGSHSRYRELVSQAVIQRNAPRVAEEMAAEDDRREVARREQRGVARQVAGSLGAGVFTFAGGMYGLGANVAGVAGFGDTERALLGLQGMADERAGSMRGRSSSFIADSLLSGFESVPVAAGTLLTGSSKLALGLFFGQTAGNSYAEARGHGLSVLRSTVYGGTQGGIEYVTEKIPVGALFDVAKGNGSISNAVKRFAVGEVLGEQAATFFQDLNTFATLTPDRPISEFIAERPEAAARTFFATLSGSGSQALVAYGLQRAARYQQQIDASEGQLSALDAMMAGAAESKARGRDPVAFRDLINGVAGEDQRLFIPANVIAEFNQSYRDDPFWSDYANEIDEAVATGGEVSIPLADAAARLAGTPDWDAVGPSARVGADGLSRTEVDEANALIEATQIEAAEQVEAEERAAVKQAAPGVKLRDSIRGQLMNAGMTPDVASSNAEIVAALFETEAANLGRTITGEEFADNISVQRELPGLIGRSQAVDEMDIVVNAMRRGGEINVGVGPSLIQFIGQQGGINDTGGDLASMGFPKRLIRDYDPAQAGMLGLSGAGEYGIDNLYRAAISAGYFPELSQVDQAEGVDTLDTNDFLEAIGRELAGDKVFSETREEVYRRAGEELREILETAGIDPDTASMEDIRAAVALFEEGRSFDQSALPETIDIDGVARPTRNSEGQPLARDEAGVRAFWAWFGDSKVVDAEGRPLVVYHGNPTQNSIYEFSDFRVGSNTGGEASPSRGFYFTSSPARAGMYADRMNAYERFKPDSAFARDPQGQITPVYLSILDPAEIDVTDAISAETILDADGGAVVQSARDDGQDGVIARREVGDEFDSIQAVAFSPTQIKSVNNRGTFDPADGRILYQGGESAGSVLQETSEGRPLVTVHNLSAENFKNAEDIGGLAAPSIAVVRADIGFDNFGEITLIAKPDLIDPKKGRGAKAFNADVYSPRQPRAQFDLYGPSLKALRSDMGDIAKELGESFDSEFDSDKLAREGLSAIEGSAIAKLAYLRSIGQDVKPVRDEKPKADPRLVKFAKAKGVGSWQDVMMSKAFEAAAVEVELEKEREAGEVPSDREVLRRKRMRIFEFDDAGEIAGLTDWYLRENAKAAFGATQPAPINRWKTREAIDKKLTATRKREAEFKLWVQENYAGLIYGRFFEARESGRRREYTMENLVREMTRTIRDGEGYNYGIGSLRSNVAKQFRSLSEIQADRGSIISEKEMDAIKEEATNEMFAILEKFRPYHRSGQDFGFADIFTEFLKDLAAGRTREWQQSIFEKPAPDDLMQEAREFLGKLRGLPTEYFEVKMQRAVGFDEFAAAVVPSDLDAGTIKRLQSYGMVVKKYERGGPRSEAIMEAANAADARILFQNETAPQGQIQFTDAKAIIKLFETANLTTFQHEMAHFWLERFKGNALASLDTDGNPAARSTFADWETVKAWFAENGHAVGADNVIPTEAHELWARSWERYLMEGKSPKTSLNSVFRKMANWFKSIYRSVKQLNAPISPEIREVMDRMLATEEEIAAAGQDRAMMLMFDDAVAAGMTEAQAARYKQLGEDARNEAEEELYGKVMRSIRARETKAWKAQERNVRMDVQDMVENRPVFQALAMLRGEYRLNRKWLVDTYGEDALKLLPAGVPPLYREDGGNADQIAEMVGFKSGDEMVRELMGMEVLRQQMKASGDKRSVKKATIDQEVAEEMHRRFGDPLTDGSIEREASAAIQNERQGERLEMELRALGAKSGKRPTPYALAREWARGRIASGVVSESVSGDAQYRYTRTASKAARAATTAFLKGDNAEAFKQKQIEMLHNALAREAAEAGDRVERAVKRMGKLAKQRTVKTLAQDYLDQIHGLLEGYEFKRVSQKAINARDNYARWAAEQTAAGHDVVAVERLAQTKNWSRLTVEELLALDEAVKGLLHLGKLKQTLMDNKARRDLDAVVGEAVMSAAMLPQKERRQMTGGEGWLDGIKGKFLSLNAALRKMEDVFDRLDGKNANGVFNRVVMRPLVEAQAAERELLDTKLAEVIAAMKAIPKESLKRWQDKRVIDELAGMDRQGRILPEPATMTGEELVSMALNMGNRGNMEKLIGGRGWDKQHGGMDAARDVVMEVLNRELTVADWQYVQQVWDIVDSLWPELSAMEKRVNGFAPDKVEAADFWVGQGINAMKLRGGYFPVVYDPASQVGARNLEIEENGLFPSSYFRATTRSGSTRERTEFKGPIHLSLGVINRHLAEVVHDITHREAVMNADKFLSDDRVRQAVVDAVGPELQAQFRPWLQHIANEWAADREANSDAEKMMKSLRTNATMVGLGFRISTIMLQVSGYANSIERVGLTAVVRGIVKSRWSPEAWNFALDNSKELRSRMVTMDRDIRDNARKLASKQKDVLDSAQQFAFHGIGYMDRLVTVATWHGAYDKSLSEGASHDDAVFFADKMVRQSQGSGAAKDMARVQRGTGKMGEAWKLASMFYSYSSAFYQRQAAFVNDTQDAVRERDLSAVPDLAARFLWLNIVPALASALLSGNGPGEDEDEAAWALSKILASQFQGIPIARDIAGALESGFGYSFTPAEGFGRSVVNLYNDAERIVEGEDTKRMTRNFLEFLGYTTGKVPGQLATSTQFLVDVGYGDQDPETAAEWWRGITKGKTEPQK